MKLYDQYEKIRRAARISERTIEIERGSHERLWKFVGHEDLLKISTQDIENFSLHLFESNLSQSYCLLILKSIRGFYSESIKQNWALSNPIGRLPLPKRAETLPVILAVPQMKKLITSPDITGIKGVRDRAILELMYSSGLRRNEIISVESEMFSNDFRTIRFIGKNQKEAVVPVGKMAAHFCKFCAEFFNEKYLFVSLKTFQPLRKEVLNRLVKSYAKECKLEGKITPHTFRYSIATHLSDQGVDIRLIQEFMRHDNINTTSGYIKHGVQKLKEIHSKTHPRG